MRLFIIFCLLTVISACTTMKTPNNNPSHANQTLSQWQGRQFNDVITKLGTPNSVLKTQDGSTYYVYTTNNYQYYPSSGLAPGFATATTGGYARVPVLENQLSSYSLLKCALIFQTNAQKTIVATYTRGYNCRSSLAYLNR